MALTRMKANESSSHKVCNDENLPPSRRSDTSDDCVSPHPPPRLDEDHIKLTAPV